jgi:hypothetical protein
MSRQLIPQPRHFVDDRLALGNPLTARLEFGLAFREGLALLAINAGGFLFALFSCKSQPAMRRANGLHRPYWRERLSAVAIAAFFGFQRCPAQTQDFLRPQ